MKTVYINVERYRTADFLFKHRFSWDGSKYAKTSISRDAFGLVIEDKKEWKLKELDFSDFNNYIIVVRGDVGFGLYWIPVKFGYWFYHKIYWYLKIKIVRFFLRSLKLGYQEEGTVLQWRSIFRKKPKKW
jgi:hypothetical protein